MQAIVATKELKAALGKVVKTAETKSYMPILNGVLLSGNGKGIELTATDLETWSHAVVGGECTRDDGSDSIVVNCAQLHELVKAMKQEKTPLRIPGPMVRETKFDPERQINVVTVREKDPCLIVGNAEIPAMALEDYPEIANDEPMPIAQIEGKSFKSLAKRVASAALRAGETTRLSLTGVYVRWSKEQGAMRFMATDGYRLESDTVQTAILSDRDGEVLIDASKLKKFATSIGAKDTITLAVTEKDVKQTYRDHEQERVVEKVVPEIQSLILDLGDCQFSFRPIRETFPDFERVIPAGGSQHTFTTEAASLLPIVKAASACAPDESGAIILRIQGNTLKVYSSSKDKGEYESSLSVQGNPAANVEIAVKAEYLINYLKLTDAEIIRFTLYAPEKAFTIQPEGAEGELFVCMPVRLDV